MNRREALQHFLKTYAEDVLNEKLHQAASLYEHSKEELILSFIQSFQSICLQANSTEVAKTRIGYITYSMRRTYLMDRNYNYVVEAYDKNWFFDPLPYRGIYDAGWAFGLLAELEDELSQLRKPYMNKVFQPDVERFVLQATGEFHQYILKLAKDAIQQAVHLPEFKAMKCEDDLEVRIGEYKGISEVVYSTAYGVLHDSTG
ncbi:hypothetical protein GMA19_04611 [Paenibacillus polymyxa E681]|uniref:hypothetical protein n=1 Tax=Paenibacillus polymyxa TaxID=1406 RepID=UPI0001E32135|nr:hypothetical protein [Paenibacillus polymyxa]ADM72367.1 hypothetical protein PPE_04608 [Paenibacillus polymyxa E681]QNV59394.1 hypothetical protein GE561_04622 [Paenibacillus polymyxa E681]QNV64220.1 hypothetical protein GMA19_04611 [Paenibacillus polymyxa E681]